MPSLLDSDKALGWHKDGTLLRVPYALRTSGAAFLFVLDTLLAILRELIANPQPLCCGGCHMLYQGSMLTSDRY